MTVLSIHMHGLRSVFYFTNFLTVIVKIPICKRSLIVLGAANKLCSEYTTSDGWSYDSHIWWTS